MINSSRTWLFRENKAFAELVSAGTYVLDVGAGEQPYRPLFEHCKYESADFEAVPDAPYGKSTYVCDLAKIPVESERFGAVLFNQVMEHVPEPSKVLDELFRVLKPGGKMICTAPLFYEEHQTPYDYYRYTQFAWRHLLEKAGFEVVELRWMEGYVSTVAYQMQTAAKYLPYKPSQVAPGLLGWLCAPVMIGCKALFAGLSLAFHKVDEQHRYTLKGYPKNYVVIVRKPSFRRTK